MEESKGGSRVGKYSGCDGEREGAQDMMVGK